VESHSVVTRFCLWKNNNNDRSTLGFAYDHALHESEQRRRDQHLDEIHSWLSKGEYLSAIDSAELRHTG